MVSSYSFISSLLVLLATGSNTYAAVSQAAIDKAVQCNKDYGKLVFVFLGSDAPSAGIEDDIRQDLAKLGFEVEARQLSKADLNVARQSGDFHFSITETWGTPYDPNSYASGWIGDSGGEGVYQSMVNFEQPATREELLEMVADVLTYDDPNILAPKWEAIHQYYHAQAVMMPFYGKRIPTLLNNRLSNYAAGFQQFDYPVHKLKVNSGSTTVKIAPGARTGLFETVGSLNAHVYGPNEFFSNNWIYEGLVSYGEDGKIMGALASEFKVAPNNIGGDTYTFTLREGVKFHDGQDWNCSVAKLNFDHVLAPALRTVKHSWYGVGLYTQDWSCTNNMEFVVRTNYKHGPYLQELTLIRPIRMISPLAFPGNVSDPTQANSCHVDWGTIDSTEFVENVTCAGIESIAGTGPFKFVSKVTKDGVDDLVVFAANEGYWNGAPAIKQLEVVRFITQEAVKEALINEEIDVIWGAGVLSDSDIVEISKDTDLQKKISVFHSGNIQNVILLLNSGKPPFDDINVRKTVIHAINKAAIVEKELSGLQKVVDNIFPLDAPYCNVDLTPKWDYDFEKAVLLSCDGTVSGNEGTKNNNSLSLGLGLGLGALFVISALVAVNFHFRNKKLEAMLELRSKEGAVGA